MTGETSWRRAVVVSWKVALALIVAGTSLFALPGSPPVVVDTLSPEEQVAAGVGWGRHPDSTIAAGVGLVEGPATPPLGRGSLSLSVPATSDIALAFAVPTGAPAQPLPTPVPWSTLSASYATYTADAAAPSSSVPTLRLVGYQALTPAPTGFTTLSFDPSTNGTVQSGVWQTWEVGPESVVFQSNAADGFCGIGDGCTLSEFAAQYPGGGWGMVQVGIGSGAPAGSAGFADAVLVRDGASAEYYFDFEVPSSEASSASIAAGAATPTGGTVELSFSASAVSATPTVPFTVTVTLPGGVVQSQVIEVDAGTTAMLSLPVPFGATHVAVTAQGVALAEMDVGFTDAMPTPTPAPAPPSPDEEAAGALAASGVDSPPAVWGAALLGAGMVAIAGARALRRHNPGASSRRDG